MCACLHVEQPIDFGDDHHRWPSVNSEHPLSSELEVGLQSSPVPMSRRESPLVTYTSSDDENAAVEPEGPPKKKR